MVWRSGGNAAIKVIVLMGILAFVLLFAMSLGLKKSLVQPKDVQRVQLKAPLSAFDSAAAYDLVEQMSALGPRTLASSAHRQSQELIQNWLADSGVPVELDIYEAVVDGESHTLTNLYVLLPGASPDTVALVTSYNTPPFTEGFSGANDGASATAWLLEWARFSAGRDRKHSMLLAWLDGRSGAQAAPSMPYAHPGATRLQHWLESNAEVEAPRYVISLEAVGDCYLNLSVDARHAPGLAALLNTKAEGFGYALHFSGTQQAWQGIHSLIAQPDIESLGIGDYEYGGSLATHQRLWHTKEDTAEHVCPESLQLLADILYHTLYSLR